MEQLVFDILFDKHLRESSLMTRNGYATYMSEKMCVDGTNQLVYARALNERLTRGMATNYEKITRPMLREQLEMLGVDSEKYAQYYTPHMKENSKNKKPQFIWDQLWYNFCLPVSSKQYRRQFTRGSRNYPYEQIVEDLKSYHDTANKLLPAENESYEKYFHMSMGYYALESHKRVDFMFKLISSLPQEEVDKIDKNYFLIKRLHPMVLVPYIENTELRFVVRHKYYRPIFFIEERLLKELQNEIDSGAVPDYNSYVNRVLKHQMIRAKAYELFKYHAQFVSTDYVKIKNFLRQSYDMRVYHKSTMFWEYIKDKKWMDINSETQQQVKLAIRKLMKLNAAFF